MREEWKGFTTGEWAKEVNVRDFIQKNYTPYDGDASFLAGPTQATSAISNCPSGTPIISSALSMSYNPIITVPKPLSLAAKHNVCVAMPLSNACQQSFRDVE